MLELTTKEELFAIRGGWISLGIVSSIIGGIIFIIGVIDGYTRPLKWRRT